MAPSNVSRILPALASAAPELTLALANINLDFTLYKAPAPPEFHGLGNALSKRRRDAAEDGHEHIVARKLGRLFQNYLPEAPALLRAYGERSSQIAHSTGSGFAGTSASGLFDDFAGLDGTSLWAAATSSYEALCLHLLACMLDRIWTAPEATSIWFELIEKRREELASLASDDPLHVSSIAAARLELSHDDLAKWDASARSWLCIADQVMKKEQTRLLLLVDETKLPVDLSKGVYQSVTSVWKTALTAIEKIINGMSHEVQNGAVILGLASWHLFPDMHVLLKDGYRIVKQDDSLVSHAGLLTFGIESHSPDDRWDGIRWSLPLAHLRYYGYPVQASATMGINSVRLSLPDFHLVVLGSFLARWGHYGIDVIAAARLILVMWDFLGFCADPDSAEAEPVTEHSSLRWQQYLRRQMPSWKRCLQAEDHYIDSFPRSNSWFRLLANAAEDLVSSEGLHRQAKERLVERGSRRFGTFLAPLPTTPQPMCGLSTLANLVPILHEEGIIHVLRAYVEKTGLEPEDVIIRYRHRQQRPEPKPSLQLEEESGVHHMKEQVKDLDVVLTKTNDDILKFLREHDDLDDDLEPNLGEKLVELRAFMEDPRRKFHHRSLIRDDDSIPVEYVRPLKQDFEPVTPTLNTTFGSVSRKRNLQEDEIQKTSKRSRRHREQLVLHDTYDVFEYATALEIAGDPSNPALKSHMRWIPTSTKDQVREEELRRCQEAVHSFRLEDVIEFGDDGFVWQRNHDEALEDALSEQQIDSQGEASFCFLYGDPRIGAVFHRTESKVVDNADNLDIDDVKQAFESKAVDPGKFLRRLGGLDQKVDDTDFGLLRQSLRAIASAATVYKLMPSATITTSIFTAPLHGARWIANQEQNELSRQHPRRDTRSTPDSSDDSDDFEGDLLHADSLRQDKRIDQSEFDLLNAYALTRPQTFACIAMFENGSLNNIDPGGLGEVMALSVANSLYVAMPLLCDPSEQPMEWEVKHVVGNIGQPGISFLVPPPNPKVEESVDELWDLVNHVAFDGELDDHFASTSLHASLNKFVVPIGLDPQGGQDVQAYFRQTLIRLHG